MNLYSSHTVAALTHQSPGILEDCADNPLKICRTIIWKFEKEFLGQANNKTIGDYYLIGERGNGFFSLPFYI